MSARKDISPAQRAPWVARKLGQIGEPSDVIDVGPAQPFTIHECLDRAALVVVHEGSVYGFIPYGMLTTANRSAMKAKVVPR